MLYCSVFQPNSVDCVCFYCSTIYYIGLIKQASIHQSECNCLALFSSLNSCLSDQIPICLYSAAVRFPQSHRWVERVRETNMVERKKVFLHCCSYETFISRVLLLSIYCMYACLPVLQIHSDVCVWVRDSFWGPSFSVNLLYKYANVCSVYLYGSAVVKEVGQSAVDSLFAVSTSFLT